MAADLSKNGAQLMAAYKEVVDGKLDTNWALFTYEGNSNIVRLAGTGDGGLDELLDELNSGKVMYAFCRVQDPNSGLPKYVLINWTGEGVKDSRKGICANHLSSIAAFLKGAHVTINARDEQDVEPDVILQKVAKASGANFSFHQRDEAFRDAPRGPVGSVYRKVNAVEEIQQTNKDDFWAQAQRDEEVRRREESQRTEEERQRSEMERRREEERHSQERERWSKERAEQIERERRLREEREKEEREEEQRAQEQQQQEQERREEQQEEQQEERRLATGGRAGSGRELDEVRSLLAQRSSNPRELFQQRERGRPAPDATPSPGRLRSPFLSQEASGAGEPPLPSAVPTPLSLISAATPAAESPPPPDTEDPPPLPPAGTENLHAAEEEEWSDDFDDDDAGEPAPVENLYDTPQPIRSEQQVPDPAPEVTAAAEDERGVCARALYDYQAADDTEITFDPDDVITHIDMLDEGWWRGYGPDGRYGMFPANYVELL